MKKIADLLATNKPALLRARLECLKTLVESAKSGKSEDLEKYYKILTDFNFIAAKINHTRFEVQVLINDYDLISDSEISTILEQKVESLKLIQETLRLSAHILDKDKTQLPCQLCGRLQCFKIPDIQKLLEQAKQSEPTLLYPLKASLTRPNGQLLRTLTGHTDSVNAVAVNRDGKRVISGSSDKTLKVWNLETGKELFNLAGHGDKVNAVAFTPNGKLLISGSNDNTLKVWDLETRKELFTLEGHSYQVNTVAVTSDSKRLISGSLDNTLKVWNLETRQMERTLTDSTNSANCIEAIVITPDDQQVISVSHGAYYEPSRREFIFKFNPKLVWIILKLVGKLKSNSLSEFQSWLFINYAKQRRDLVIWDLKTGERQILHVEKGDSLSRNRHRYLRSSGVAITPDGKQVISSSHNKTLKAWNLKSGKNEGILIGYTEYLKAVSVTPDGKQVISGSLDNTLEVWNLKTREESLVLSGHTASVNAVAVTPNSRLAISGSDDNTLKIWKLNSEPELSTRSNDSHSVKAAAITNNYLYGYKGNACTKAVALTSNNKWLILARDDESLVAYNLESPGEMFTFASSLNQAFAVTSDSKQVISGLTNGKLNVWNLETGKKSFSLESSCGYYEDYQDFAKAEGKLDGRLYIAVIIGLIVAMFSHAVDHFFNFCHYYPYYCWDYFILTMYFLQIVFVFIFIIFLPKFFALMTYDPHVSLAVTSDGEKVISGSSWGSLRVWNLKTRKRLFTLKVHTDSVNTIAIIPNSPKVVSGSDKTLKIWNLQARKKLFTLEGHEGKVNAVAVTPDGCLAISGSDDKTLKVWNLETGKELFTIKDHSGKVNAVAVTPDSKLAISGSDDNTLRVWDLSSGNKIAKFTGDSAILCCAVSFADKEIVAAEASGRVHFLRLEQT